MAAGVESAFIQSPELVTRVLQPVRWLLIFDEFPAILRIRVTKWEGTLFRLLSCEGSILSLIMGIADRRTPLHFGSGVHGCGVRI